MPALEDVDGVDVLARHDGQGPRVLVVGIGAMVGTALAVGELLAAHGSAVTVVDPVWALPVPAALVKLVGEHDHVVTIEDGLVDGGIGALLGQRARGANVPTPVQSFGVPAAFLQHAQRDEVIDELRLKPHDVAADVLGALGAEG